MSYCEKHGNHSIICKFCDEEVIQEEQMKFLPIEDQPTGLRALDDRIHDTSEITDIYLARPTWQANQSLGVWFCNAHGLVDADLKLSASGQLTKKLMWMRNYTKFPIEPLLKYNQSKEKAK